MDYAKHKGKGYGNYELYPKTQIGGCKGQAWQGYSDIVTELCRRMENTERTIVVAECYPGCDTQAIAQELTKVGFDACFPAECCVKDSKILNAQLQERLTDDRVFGYLSPEQELSELFDMEKLMVMREEISRSSAKRILVYGTGASLAADQGLLVYFDLTRREIQKRYAAGMGNFHGGNEKEAYLSKIKRGYFIEWRMADRQKAALFSKMDYIVDINRPRRPAMCTGEAFRRGMLQLSRQPFRLVPYFAPEVWGGQWMKEVFGLDHNGKNYAWGFDGVPEENSVVLDFEGIPVELPAMNLVLLQPENLLGNEVFQRFGPEFPIRFDLLDTIEGQNLSLQVHPTREYMKENFGLSYTQDESYYILDTLGEESYVCLGLSSGADKTELEKALREAETTATFDTERFVNRFPVKKHDHVLIPAGTVHCSGSNTMVLEISATPFLFTFKMWDWGRLGLDGKPRPTHIDRAMENIDFTRDHTWTEQNLLHRERVISRADGLTEEHTGLHELEFIESRRCTFSEVSHHATRDTVHVLNLVEGAEAVVESPNSSFPAFHIHYAETFIIPASVEKYTIRPCGISKGKSIAVVKAFVRHSEPTVTDA